MESLDEQLLRYRCEKAKEKYRQDLIKKSKHIGEKCLGIGGFFLNLFRRVIPMSNGQHSVSVESDDEDGGEEEEQEEDKPFNYIMWLTIFLVWASIYMFFIYIEFGAVYFCVTMLFFVYFNTRTGRKLCNEVSAYSVFNRNCESIEGTFSAEQIEKQIRSGMMM